VNLAIAKRNYELEDIKNAVKTKPCRENPLADKDEA
jgi:hypothetical protein